MMKTYRLRARVGNLIHTLFLDPKKNLVKKFPTWLRVRVQLLATRVWDLIDPEAKHRW